MSLIFSVIILTLMYYRRTWGSIVRYPSILSARRWSARRYQNKIASVDKTYVVDNKGGCEIQVMQQGKWGTQRQAPDKTTLSHRTNNLSLIETNIS